MEAAEILMGGALRNGTSVEWWTPPHVFDALGLEFDLDPCAPPEGDAPWIPARRRFTQEMDGLPMEWSGRIWLNPPYGREAGKWVAKLGRHHANGGEGVALVFVRTCARWCQSAIAAADAVCFIAGRLSFIDGTETVRSRRGHNAANGSMLLAYGPECVEAVLNCGLGVTFTQPHYTGGDEG